LQRTKGVLRLISTLSMRIPWLHVKSTVLARAIATWAARAIVLREFPYTEQPREEIETSYCSCQRRLARRSLRLTASRTVVRTLPFQRQSRAVAAFRADVAAIAALFNMATHLTL